MRNPYSTMAPRGQNQRNKRNFLSLEQKKRVLDELSQDFTYTQIIKKVDFKVSKGQISSIAKNRAKIEEEYGSTRCQIFRQPLKSRHPEIEKDVIETVTWLRSQRAPVTLSLIVQTALESAEAHNFNEFKASRGWLEKFLRRNRIQASVRLHGCAADVCKSHYKQEMQRIRAVMAQYEPKNIYNEDESGLLYRAIPNRTYLMENESRRDERGTSLMKQKDRISIVFCTNSTGSHKLPMAYIGRAHAPRCLRDRADMRPRYYSQKNAWMDSERFKDWLQFWYAEIQKESTGPWLLLLNNCSGHKDLPTLSGVSYQFLPANTTVHFQPVDQGIISATKKKFNAFFSAPCSGGHSRLHGGEKCSWTCWARTSRNQGGKIATHC